MAEWEFYRVPGSGADDAPFHWAWRCLHSDGNIVTTGDTFRFLLDCVAHARLHGYCNGPLHTRREVPYGGVMPLPRVQGMQARATAR